MRIAIVVAIVAALGCTGKVSPEQCDAYSRLGRELAVQITKDVGKDEARVEKTVRYLELSRLGTDIGCAELPPLDDD